MKNFAILFSILLFAILFAKPATLHAQMRSDDVRPQVYQTGLAPHQIPKISFEFEIIKYVEVFGVDQQYFPSRYERYLPEEYARFAGTYKRQYFLNTPSMYNPYTLELDISSNIPYTVHIAHTKKGNPIKQYLYNRAFIFKSYESRASIDWDYNRRYDPKALRNKLYFELEYYCRKPGTYWIVIESPYHVLERIKVKAKKIPQTEASTSRSQMF